jgi:hypothetical protein
MIVQFTGQYPVIWVEVPQMPSIWALVEIAGETPADWFCFDVALCTADGERPLKHGPETRSLMDHINGSRKDQIAARIAPMVERIQRQQALAQRLIRLGE